MTAPTQQFTPSPTHAKRADDSAPAAVGRAELAQLDDTEFERLVIANAFRGSRDPATWAALTSPELIERTHNALFNASERNAAAIARRRQEWAAFRTECFAQPIEKQLWLAKKRDYDTWHTKAANFARGVSRALRDLNAIRARSNLDTPRYGTQYYRRRIRELALAIQAHRAALTDTNLVAEAHDRRLWRILDEITVPTGAADTPTTLQTMLDSYWKRNDFT
ncbi:MULTISPECIES: hypothetical protein [Mycobacterium]|nr:MULTISPECIES: hypothetical protein [Mycobacterium]MCV7034895.1 hypothetical protein [Mycobacterium heckeshornense]